MRKTTRFLQEPVNFEVDAVEAILTFKAHLFLFCS